jgi:hypothetical protein
MNSLSRVRCAVMLWCWDIIAKLESTLKEPYKCSTLRQLKSKLIRKRLHLKKL